MDQLPSTYLIILPLQYQKLYIYIIYNISVPLRRSLYFFIFSIKFVGRPNSSSRIRAQLDNILQDVDGLKNDLREFGSPKSQPPTTQMKPSGPPPPTTGQKPSGSPPTEDKPTGPHSKGPMAPGDKQMKMWIAKMVLIKSLKMNIAKLFVYKAAVQSKDCFSLFILYYETCVAFKVLAGKPGSWSDMSLYKDIA